MCSRSSLCPTASRFRSLGLVVPSKINNSSSCCVCVCLFVCVVMYPLLNSNVHAHRHLLLHWPGWFKASFEAQGFDSLEVLLPWSSGDVVCTLLFDVMYTLHYCNICFTLVQCICHCTVMYASHECNVYFILV